MDLHQNNTTYYLEKFEYDFVAAEKHGVDLNPKKYDTPTLKNLIEGFEELLLSPFDSDDIWAETRVIALLVFAELAIVLPIEKDLGNIHTRNIVNIDLSAVQSELLERDHILGFCESPQLINLYLPFLDSATLKSTEIPSHYSPRTKEFAKLIIDTLSQAEKSYAFQD